MKSSSPTACAASPPSRPARAPSARPCAPSRRRRRSNWASAGWRTRYAAPPPISTSSMLIPSVPRCRPRMSSPSPLTAGASSCSRRPCGPGPPRQRPAPSKGSPPGSPRARRPTASAWPRWPPSSTLRPCPAPPEDILASTEEKRGHPAPHASGKRVTASVVADLGTVIGQGFAEAQRRSLGALGLSHRTRLPQPPLHLPERREQPEPGQRPAQVQHGGIRG